MSAFVVSKNHIAQLVRFYMVKKQYDDKFNGKDGVEWANKLMAKNVASVNYRYEDNEEINERAETFTMKDILFAKLITPVEALKAIRGLNYQSCELEDWNTSPERKFLDKIDDAAVWALPGIDKAAWSIN